VLVKVFGENDNALPHLLRLNSQGLGLFKFIPVIAFVVQFKQISIYLLDHFFSLFWKQ